ncbi:hypothetical protein UA08_04694 [Talaromyces atroroseus]|uniref:Uncharacterized protein n=1 Tax=Talaromyces atroroseus TaxID=1441469 RepID=A0A225AYR3_TALAT|nr:hypothetical protein UA08_04694 [Talaromyces atroroseus]OKL60106.1 hypothetical protein UA08_04694 [Talaromyces atroroseus]
MSLVIALKKPRGYLELAACLIAISTSVLSSSGRRTWFDVDQLFMLDNNASVSVARYLANNATG